MAFCPPALFSQTANQCETNVWQHANDILSLWNRLPLSLATGTSPPPVYIQSGALVLYKQTALVARGLIRRRSANPIKSSFVCLKTGKETGKEATCCSFCAKFCLCADG